MRNIILAFVVSLGFSLLFTPFMAKLGNVLKGIDWPNKRKVHTRPIPRTGGLGIFLVFWLSWYLIDLYNNIGLFNFLEKEQILFFLLGGLIVLGIGLVDDFFRLGYKTKFLFQIVGASLAFFGGLRIEVFFLNDFYLEFGYLSYFVTLFWFILLINAINLIDGLDGLAGGIIFFVCLVMVVLLNIQEFHLLSISYSLLAGSVLGFLFYNFNPAKVFLGDSGSYFLGYMMAGLSIMGSVSVKSQVSTSILLPLFALGVPILDTLIAPLRRLLNGKKMFYPDKGHIHHSLMRLGFSKYKSVWIIYLLTMLLCLFSIYLVNVRNQMVALCLVLFGLGCIVFFQSCRRLYKYAFDLFIQNLNNFPFFNQMHHKATFGEMHEEITKSRDINELWSGMTSFLKELQFDEAECRLKINYNGDKNYQKQDSAMDSTVSGQAEVNKSNNNLFKLHWTRNGGLKWKELTENTLYKFEFDILGKYNDSIGKLILFKDIRQKPLKRNTHKYLKDMSKTFSHTLHDQDLLSNLDN